MIINQAKQHLIQSSLVFMFFLQTMIKCEELSAHVSPNLLGTGFHRNLLFQVQFNDVLEGCYVAIYLQLPPALYVNVNELSDLRRRGISIACSIGETDVELFTGKAKAQAVTVCSPLTSTTCTLKFPLHQRYQYAMEYGEYVNITLPKPKLLLGCKQRIREYRVSNLDLCSPCTKFVAKWREIPYNMDMEDVWITPIGDTSMLPIVTYVTLLLTVLCTVFLARTICKSMPTQHPKQE